MNVIISNVNQRMLDELNIDVIKRMNGEYDVDDIISQFQHYFFQRMILDITALKNYKDITTLQKLSIALNMDKIILLLDDSEESTSPGYLSKLISIGIYNFTKNLEGIMYLYNNPNTYRDVAQYHQLDPVVNNIVKTVEIRQKGTIVIGIKNVTKQAGATSLIYMLKKQLEKNYSILAYEIDRKDFAFFKDKNMISIQSGQLASEIIKNNKIDIILVDINNSMEAEYLVHETIYLIEPSIIKLNRLMAIDPRCFAKYKDKKVVLNKSLLTSKDVSDFEYESRLKVFFNMPPLNDRSKENPSLSDFIRKLGLSK